MMINVTIILNLLFYFLMMMMMMMIIIIINNNNNIQPTLSLPATVTQNPALERSSLYAAQALSLSQSNLHPLVDAEWLRAWRNRRLRIAGGQWEMWVAVQCEVRKVGKNDGFNIF